MSATPSLDKARKNLEALKQDYSEQVPTPLLELLGQLIDATEQAGSQENHDARLAQALIGRV